MNPNFNLSLIPENIQRLESGESITDFERNLFNIILETCSIFQQNFQINPIVRVAGGWVRDRILGKESSDIDLAVENVGCRDFAEELRKHTNSKSKIAIIEANAEMSKHMETVRVCLFHDFWLDICGLRPADYNAINTFGTPQEDAQRRDFTINALFYNINSGKIEDFVNGINDLQNCILRTPVDPKITFTEDPLRIIRGFRFAAKYGLTFDHDLFQTIPLMREMLEQKVAKERISAELIKSFESSSPLQIIEMIIRSGLFSSVFNPSHSFPINEEVTFQRIQIALSRIENTENTDSILVILLAAIYYDLSQLPPMVDPMKPKKKIDPIEFIVTREMKISLKISYDVSLLLKSENILKTFPNQLDRLSVAHWIRIIGENWRSTRCIIFDDNLLYFFDGELTQFINDQNLIDTISMKPLFNGKELAAVHNIRPGPHLGKLVEQLFNWQVMNPQATQNDYIEFVKSQNH
ncbi:putative CCA tRNA nucleotidyltransferase 1 [Tritrichomonas foetus]|uniref:CCA tRNA nucleotidyltransferase 1 n=1 Tax=Tritrichomonas foetus TaxID=1144522 RepID=A0A1J4K045_9EUKA|nr:putative CCA tRNA nucleotidyltransferase 1 [Tritrichomonas foetus]|eukprot:OHT04793.1 putative CCA tRNA nucleotidyltransferase 1 [Tritrichomonas foetus]